MLTNDYYCEKVIKKIAVLGAGVMGAQIAAHFVNAGFSVVLFDLPSASGDPSALAANSIKELLHLQPAPLAITSDSQYIEPANYQDDLSKLSHCQLVIEAIAERFDWKRDIYLKILPYLSAEAILVSNTSGFSINGLCDILPGHVQSRFLGMHFFNPPRYLSLVELVASEKTNPELLSCLETFLVRYLGRIVVRVKDTPNFIANRIGAFSLLATLYHADHYRLGFDVVDTLTGPVLGRPKSATLRTIDVIGLDTFAHTITTLCSGLPDDPWRWLYVTPNWLQSLMDRGHLGQKTHQGIYQKKAGEYWVYDINKENYRQATHKPSHGVMDILALPTLKERLIALRRIDKPEAQFIWSIFRDLFHYCAVHLTTIAGNVRDIDLALSTGFGWQQGPFSIWQDLGWFDIVERINADIERNKTLSNTPLPEWVYQVPDGKVYTENGAYSPVDHTYHLPNLLPVYQRQLYPAVVGIKPLTYGQTIDENAAVRLWHDDEIAILSFNSKMGTFDDAVLEGILLAIEKATKNYQAVVIGTFNKNYFSVGANLQYFLNVVQQKNEAALQNTLMLLQQAGLAMRYAAIPVVAAFRGYALGGGCELMLHADSVIVSLESSIGLVEPSVGLLPAGGGCKELTLRASQLAPHDPYVILENSFKHIVLAKASKSAKEAKTMGFLRESDVIVMNPHELLFIAKQQAKHLATMNYRPPQRQKIHAIGRHGTNRLHRLLNSMQEEQLISVHDKLIATKIAYIMSGGDVETGALVDEKTLLHAEREAFIELTRMPETVARIEYFLKTGKKLTN